MASTDNQELYRPSTPTMPALFSPPGSPTSTLGTSPSSSLRSSHQSPAQTKGPPTNHPDNPDEDVFEDASDTNPRPVPVTLPEAINMEENIIYNETTVKYMKIIQRYQELLGGGEIQLPRLVITGAQSSGKSSLLENLTGLPVPITPGIGTRFPIEITLIEAQTYTIKATIVRDLLASRTSRAEKKIDEFIRTYDKTLTVAEFESLLRETSSILGLPEPIFGSHQTSRPGMARWPNSATISRHTLRIEMRGPQFKNLSLVDTPGLYRTGNEEQDGASAFEIKKLVETLISEKRTIIIAVMDATEGTAQQSIFEYTRNVDAEGERTIGVLTKCDNLPMNQKHEVQKALSRAANKELHLSHGWYVVKNRSSSEAELGISIQSARDTESTLFSTEPWAPESSGLLKSRMGIDSLRIGLSTLFCSHIRSEFPKFNAQTRKLLLKKRAKLEALGPARSTEAQQRDYLRIIVAKYQTPKLKCLHDDRRHAEPKDPTRIDRKLAVIKKVELRDALQVRGCAWTFQTPRIEVDFASDIAANALIGQGGFTDNVYTWINSRFQSSKACEVPGLVPYQLVERLFEEQTANWVFITQHFVEKVKDVLTAAVKHCLIQACGNPRVFERLWELVEKRIDEKLATLAEECLRLIEHHRRGVQIVAHESDFVSTLNMARTSRIVSAVARLEEQLSFSFAPTNDIRPFKSLKGFMAANTQSLMEVLTNERQIIYQIHDILKAYYNLSIGHYTETVCKNFLNASMVSDVMDVFSTAWVDRLSAEEVDTLVGESIAEREERSELQEGVKKYETAIRDAEDILRQRD